MPPRARRTSQKTPGLAEAVEGALESLPVSPADAGAIRLAIQYAESIDAAEDRAKALELLGPRLLAALDALGLTPKARSAMKGGVPTHGSSPLDELRARRASGAS